MLKIELLDSTINWDSLRADWNRLDQGVLCRGFDWISAWNDAYEAQYQPVILTVREDSEIIGILPLVQHQTLATGSTLSWMGTGRACSDNMGILAADEDQLRVAHSLADHLLALTSSGVRWDHLDLDGVYASDYGMNRLVERLQEVSPEIQLERRASLQCWRIPSLGTFQQHMTQVSKRVRKIYNEGIQHLDNGGLCEIASTPTQAMDFLSDVEKLHQSRWNARGEGGCFETTEFQEFLRLAVERHAQADSSQMVVIRTSFHGKPAAGLVAFVKAGTFSIYLTGMSPEFGEVRAGWITNFAAIERACQLGCHTVDFMRGDEDYKARLGGVPEAQERWIVTNPRWISRLRNKAYQTVRVVKDWPIVARLSQSLSSRRVASS